MIRPDADHSDGIGSHHRFQCVRYPLTKVVPESVLMHQQDRSEVSRLISPHWIYWMNKGTIMLSLKRGSTGCGPVACRCIMAARAPGARHRDSCGVGGRASSRGAGAKVWVLQLT